MAGEVQVRVIEERGSQPYWVPLTTSVAGIGYMKLAKVASGTIAAANVAAFSFAWNNPETVQIMVVKVVLNITVAGGAAGVIDVGTAATATTTSENLIDSLNHNQTGIFDNAVNGGANGKGAQIMDKNGGTTDYITASIATQNAASLAGTYYIVYIPLT